MANINYRSALDAEMQRRMMEVEQLKSMEDVRARAVQAVNDALSTPTFDFEIGGHVIMRVARDGFYVRGERIPQDADEALRVYDAFRAWLTLQTAIR